jgi:hypothetical protein
MCCWSAIETDAGRYAQRSFSKSQMFHEYAERLAGRR